MAFERNNCQTDFLYCSQVTRLEILARRLGVASVVDNGCIDSEGSFTNNNDIGTIAVLRKAKAPITQEKDKPRSKEPLYSREFMPKPTKATAKMLPTVRTCVEIKVLQRVPESSRRRLLDGVAVPVPHRSTAASSPRNDFHTGPH